MSSSEEQIVEATGTAICACGGLLVACGSCGESRCLVCDPYPRDAISRLVTSARRIAADRAAYGDVGPAATELRDALAALDASPPASVPSPPEPAEYEALLHLEQTVIAYRAMLDSGGAADDEDMGWAVARLDALRAEQSSPGQAEPQPGDGPDYHADHAFWKERNQ